MKHLREFEEWSEEDFDLDKGDLRTMGFRHFIYDIKYEDYDNWKDHDAKIVKEWEFETPEGKTLYVEKAEGVISAYGKTGVVFTFNSGQKYIFRVEEEYREDPEMSYPVNAIELEFNGKKFSISPKNAEEDHYDEYIVDNDTIAGNMLYIYFEENYDKLK